SPPYGQLHGGNRRGFLPRGGGRRAPPHVRPRRPGLVCGTQAGRHPGTCCRGRGGDPRGAACPFRRCAGFRPSIRTTKRAGPRSPLAYSRVARFRSAAPVESVMTRHWHTWLAILVISLGTKALRSERPDVHVLAGPWESHW